MCTIIDSDNARTLKTAGAELKKMWQVLNNLDDKNFYTNKGIQWIYMIERGAWWGGFYERLLRTIKTLMRKVLCRKSLVLDKLEVVLTETESWLITDLLLTSKETVHRFCHVLKQRTNQLTNRTIRTINNTIRKQIN